MAAGMLGVGVGRAEEVGLAAIDLVGTAPGLVESGLAAECEYTRDKPIARTAISAVPIAIPPMIFFVGIFILYLNSQSPASGFSMSL
jgi:hypothetical protein